MVRRRRPDRGPTLYDLLPVWCEECGDKLGTVEDVSDHEHEAAMLEHPPGHEPAPHCSVCNPRPREHKRQSPTFCDSHDRDDLRAMEEAMAPTEEELEALERQYRGEPDGS